MSDIEGAESDFRSRMSYGDYLRFPELLAAQSPLTDARDELLFIIQHQTSELWMKLAIGEIHDACALIRADSVQPAFKLLARVARIFEQLNKAWDVRKRDLMAACRARIWIGLGVHLNRRWTPDGGAGRSWGAAANDVKPRRAQEDRRGGACAWRLCCGGRASAWAERQSHFQMDTALARGLARSAARACEGEACRGRATGEGGPAFVPVKLLELDAPSAPPPSDVIAKPARQTRRGARRGAMEISLPNGAKVSLDADVDAEALRRVLSALGVA